MNQNKNRWTILPTKVSRVKPEGVYSEKYLSRHSEINPEPGT